MEGVKTTFVYYVSSELYEDPSTTPTQVACTSLKRIVMAIVDHSLGMPLAISKSLKQVAFNLLSKDIQGIQVYK